MSLLYSIIESPLHIDFSSLYRQMHIEARHFNSTRKAMSMLKKQSPDFILAEFIYGYSNNYAGINISNLDVLLYALQKYAPACKLVLLCRKQECGYCSQLNDIFPLHAVLELPVNQEQMHRVLKGDG